MLDILNSVGGEIFSFLQMLSDASGGLSDKNHFCQDSEDIWRFVGSIVNILQIAIPVIIILLGTIDLGKAVMAGEDKKIKEAQGMLIKRLIYGAAVFFLVVIIRVIFGLVAGSGEATTSGCFNCVADPSDNCATAVNDKKD